MWHNLTARECAAEAQAGSRVAEKEQSSAHTAPGRAAASAAGALRAPLCRVIPSHRYPQPRYLQLPPPNTRVSHPPGHSLGWDGGKNPVAEPGPVCWAGGCSHLPATPLSSCLVIPHGMRQAGTRRLAATALRKELIFTDTFSPNKVVFGSDDTSQPRTQQPLGWRRGSAWKGGEKTPL